MTFVMFDILFLCLKFFVKRNKSLQMMEIQQGIRHFIYCQTHLPVLGVSVTDIGVMFKFIYLFDHSRENFQF